MSETQVVTDDIAKMLAMHAVYVQGGFSTPEAERERAEKQISESGPIDFGKMRDEVDAAVKAKVAALPPAPAPAPAPPVAQRVDVSAVMVDIDMAKGLRDRIKSMQNQLKMHEDQIKDALGKAAEGVDSTGKVVIQYPERSRHDLIKAEVQKVLTDEQFGACSKATTYRVLIFP